MAFEEVSGHRVLLNCGPGNQGRSTWGTSHGACLEFPREAGLILRGAGNPFQTTQGNQLSCREQERSRSSEEVVPGLSVFPQGNLACRGTFGCRMKGVRYRVSLHDGTWALEVPLRAPSPEGKAQVPFQRTLAPPKLTVTWAPLVPHLAKGKSSASQPGPPSCLFWEEGGRLACLSTLGVS